MTKSHFSRPPAMPTTRQPRILAICPTTWPTAPDAAETTTVSPAFGWPMSSSPTQAVSPGMPSTPSEAESGASAGSIRISRAAGTREKRCQPIAAEHRVARREAGRAGGHHLARRLPLHHRADLDRLGVGLRVRHAAAHVGVERQEARAHQHLALRGLGRRRFADLEIVRRGLALRAAAKQDLQVGFGHGVVLLPIVLRRATQHGEGPGGWRPPAQALRDRPNSSARA